MSIVWQRKAALTFWVLVVGAISFLLPAIVGYQLSQTWPWSTGLVGLWIIALVLVLRSDKAIRWRSPQAAVLIAAMTATLLLLQEWAVPVVIAVGLEIFALLLALRSDEVVRTRWLPTASVLTAMTAALLLLPPLIEEVGGDRVYWCWIECSGDEEGTNLSDLYFSLWLVGLGSGVASIVAWSAFLLRVRRGKGLEAGIEPG